MSAEAELIFTALLNDLRFHPFIIELLDLGGYDTLIKLKVRQYFYINFLKTKKKNLDAEPSDC